jgi:hypothetical protein
LHSEIKSITVFAAMGAHVDVARGVRLRRVAVDYGELEGVAVGELGYRRHRLPCARRRGRFAIASEPRDWDRTDAADAHRTLPAHSYCDSDDQRTGTDLERASTKYNDASANHDRAGADHNGGSAPVERPRPAADLAARPDRILCRDRSHDLPPGPSADPRSEVAQPGG